MRFLDKKVRLLNRELDSYLYDIEKLFKTLKRRNLKLSRTSTEDFLFNVDKSSMVIMMYGFLETLLCKFLVLVYQTIKDDEDGKFSNLSDGVKKHVIDNLMKLDRGSQLSERKENMSENLFKDLDEKCSFSLINGLLDNYYGFLKPFYVKDNVKFRNFSDLIKDLSDIPCFTQESSSRMGEDLKSILQARNILSHGSSGFYYYGGRIYMSDLEKWKVTIGDLKNQLIKYLDSYIYKKLYLSQNKDLQKEG